MQTNVRLDTTSWYQLQYRRETTIQDDSTLGFNFYNTAGATAMVIIWSPLFIVSLATSKPVKIHTTQFVGSCVAILIRMLYAFIELGRLRKIIDDRAYEMWVQSFDETRKEPVEDLDTTSRLQFPMWDLSAAVMIAVALVAVGGKNVHDMWLWWIGVTIIAEVVFRVVIQILWRKTSVGKKVKAWVKKKGMW